MLVLLSLFGSAQSTASRNVSTFTMESPQLDTIRKIWVYLPCSYSEGHKNYPVLYLQDAQNLFDAETSFAGEWRVDETLDSLGVDIIVIGIEHGNEKRIAELTPFAHPEYKGGNAANYLNFITKTLKPFIDKKFRTIPEAKGTFIGGSSLGGLMSFYAIFQQPEIFGKALVFSPSFWFTEDIFDFAETINPEILEDVELYLRAGEKESETMIPLMIKMKELLIKKGIKPENLNVGSIPEGEHNEALWKSLFPQAAQWLLGE